MSEGEGLALARVIDGQVPAAIVNIGSPEEKPSNLLTRLLPHSAGAVFMIDSNDRPELERRLNQARRMFDVALDPLTKERLEQLIRDLERLLRPPR